jgi:hypothetical protein
MEAILNPTEEVVLNLIKNTWEERKKKISIADLRELLERKGIKLSHEKVRLIVESLWRKGEILIDVHGRERIVRPNHVIVNSKSKPLDFRNFTILDKDGKPIQRIWVSVYKDKKGQVYFTISESKWNGSWKTTNNIIIPPEAKEELREVVKFIEKWIE